MKKLLVVFCVIVLVLGVMETANAWTQFNDGGIYNINYVINDDVWVDYNMPGAQTTVNFQPGGIVPHGYQIKGYEDSNINIVGGSTNYFYLYDSTKYFVSGGDVDGIVANDNTQVTISGGDVGSIQSSDNSQVTISYGDIYYYCISDNSQVNMSGGTVELKMNCGGNSQLTMSGGTIDGKMICGKNSQATMSGGTIGDGIKLGGTSIFSLYGSGFAVDGAPIEYGELTSILGADSSSEPNRILTGVLASGDAFNNDFKIGNSAKIVLAPATVPIPSAIMLFGSGLFGLFGIRRKFKKV